MNKPFVNIEKAKSRYIICKQCKEFNPIIKVCSKCGCIMPLKVILSAAECPIKKWTTQQGDADNDYNFEE